MTSPSLSGNEFPVRAERKLTRALPLAKMPAMQRLFRWAYRWWHNINGLVTVGDILAMIGFWLYRGTAKRTTAVAIAFFTLFLLGSKTQVDTGISLANAFTGTGLVMIASFFGGLALMFVSGSLARQALALAEAKGSNLLEDMKKARQPEHAATLWKCIYQYEARLVEPHQIEQEKQTLDQHAVTLRESVESLICANVKSILPEHLNLLRDLGLTEPGFRMIFSLAMAAPLPASTLRRRLRYDLIHARDWYDGAPFHQTDTKLYEHYNNSGRLTTARKLAGLGVMHTSMVTARQSMQILWFKSISRAIQLRVARACRQLDRKYPHFHFLPDHFLWPVPESEEGVRDQLGQVALDDLIDTRRKVFQRIFNPEPELAHQLMRLAIYPTFQSATILRQRFDPEYTAGELEQSWAEDLKQYHQALQKQSRGAVRINQTIAKVKEMLDAGRGFLDEHCPGYDSQSRRVVLIALHTNQFDLHQRIKAAHSGDAQAVAHAREAVKQAVDQSHHLTRVLLAVRLHHTLARMELDDYACYLQRILC